MPSFNSTNWPTPMLLYRFAFCICTARKYGCQGQQSDQSHTRNMNTILPPSGHKPWKSAHIPHCTSQPPQEGLLQQSLPSLMNPSLHRAPKTYTTYMKSKRDISQIQVSLVHHTLIPCNHTMSIFCGPTSSDKPLTQNQLKRQRKMAHVFEDRGKFSAARSEEADPSRSS